MKVRYKIEEYYKGKIIWVNVIENWNENGIESAMISSYGSPIIRNLGHCIGNYKTCSCGVIGKVVKPLNVNDVNSVIFSSLINSEKRVDFDINNEYHDLEKRGLKIIFDYRGQEIVIDLYINFINDSIFICTSDEMVFESSLNDNFRKVIFSQLCRIKDVIHEKNREYSLNKI